MKLISKQEVKHIAKLARIKLTEEEVRQTTKDLAGILEHFSNIQIIDTTDTLPAEDVTGLNNITREDEAKPDIICDTEELLEAAPDKHNRHFKVKAVFD